MKILIFFLMFSALVCGVVSAESCQAPTAVIKVTPYHAPECNFVPKNRK